VAVMALLSRARVWPAMKENPLQTQIFIPLLETLGSGSSISNNTNSILETEITKCYN
jgi:hypothetical protein